MAVAQNSSRTGLAELCANSVLMFEKTRNNILLVHKILLEIVCLFHKVHVLKYAVIDS